MRPMNRRRFLARSALAAIAVSGVAIGWRRLRLPQHSLVALVDHLQVLRASPLRSSGSWSPYQVFTHLAQSVAYSIDGYPQMKPAWFQHSLGGAAFFAFETAGAMRHGLDQPIPGAPDIATEGDAGSAIDALIQTLQRFDAHNGALQPHFAYGALDKGRYLAAHIMHVRNHLDEILY
jgi:Protein of unknown function (DUF1569)